ncbi:MAG TPA: DUF420 domain-containing protein [Sphingobacteriaceae bacterium]
MNWNDKVIFRLIAALSVVVFLVVLVLQSNVFTVFPDKTTIPGWVLVLPKLNAFINGTCALLLLASLYFIRKGNVAMHKRLNLSAFLLSALFMVSYIIFHSTGIKTTFGGQGGIRFVYYFILITHIILAAVVLPLVFLSLYRGLQMQVERHRKLVRWSYPIWLYVTVSGVIVYIMIAPYYSFG